MLSKLKQNLFVTLTLILANCTSFSRSSVKQLVDFDAAIKQLVSCENEQHLVVFTLEKPEGAGPNEKRIRLELCTSDDTSFTLRRVVYQIYSFALPIIIDGINIRDEKLDAALFGEMKDLNLKFFSSITSHGKTEGLSLTSTSDKNIIVQRWIKEEDGSEIEPSNEVEFGSFVLGDPFLLVGDASNCKLSESYRESMFSIDTAIFKIKMCTFLGGGETIGYRIFEVKVTDTNQKLPEEARKEQVLAKEALANVLAYKYYHHNACDYFLMKLENVTYALTTAPIVGLVKTPPETPQRTLEEPEETAYKTLYRVTYNGNTVSEGALSKSHYLW